MIGITFVIQIIFIQTIGEPVKCSPLPLGMLLSSMALGSFALVFAYIEKILPDFNIPMLIKEKDEVDKYSMTKGIMSMAGMGPYRENRSGIIR